MNAPRRWFRIHLSTAIVLMFVAGGLMWLNNVTEMLKPVTMIVPHPFEPHSYTNEKLPDVGWPWKVYGEYKIFYHNFTSDGDLTRGYAYNLQHESKKSLGNLGVALLILASTAFLLERRIRRSTTPNPKL